ncbi:MAG: glucose-6-phosphate isomerase, partial [Chloroflexota bacterium]
GPAGDGFSAWVEQLIAESTGKEGRGIVPVAYETPGQTAAYGADRLFIETGAPSALTPAVELPGRSLATLGGEFFRWEFAIAVAGHILGINAFDQPNVEEAKQAARTMLTSGGAAPPVAGDLRSAIAGVVPGDYLGLLAY